MTAAEHKLSTMKRNSIGSTENVHFNDELTVTQFARECLPPRGPVVDMCGPGTLFERGKIHSIAKARRLSQVEYSGIKLSSLSLNRSEMERSVLGRRRKSSEESSGSEKNQADSVRKNIYVLEPVPLVNKPFEPTRGMDEASDSDRNKLNFAEKENEKVSPRLQWHLDNRTFSESDDVGKRREFATLSMESSDHDLAALEARIQAWKQMYPVVETKRRQSVSNSVRLHRGKIHHTLPGITVVLRPKPTRITDMTSQFGERLHVKENPVERRKSTMIERALNGRLGVQLPEASTDRDSDTDSEQDEITVQVKEIVSKHPVSLRMKEREAFKRQYTVEEYRTLRQHMRASQKDLMRYGVFH